MRDAGLHPVSVGLNFGEAQVRKRRGAEVIITQIHDVGTAMAPFGDELGAGEIEELAAFLRERRKVVTLPPKLNEKPAPGHADKDTD